MEISVKELCDAINMYLDSKRGIINIYTDAIIESSDDIIDIYMESSKDTRRSNCIRLWKHMIKWDYQRHKQTRSWFMSIKTSIDFISNKSEMLKPGSNDEKFYIDNKLDMFRTARKEAFDDCKHTNYMTGIVPNSMPDDYDIHYICSGNNWIKWICDRAENDEVFNIPELSNIRIPKIKSSSDIPVADAFNSK